MSATVQANCSDLQAHIAALALGDLEPSEELLEHLAKCPPCRTALCAYVRCARMKHKRGYTAPSPALRERILAACSETTPQTEQSS
jgi:hypothetical protein